MITEYGTTPDYDFSEILDLGITGQLRILETIAIKRSFLSLSDNEVWLAGHILIKRIDSPDFIPEELKMAASNINSEINTLNIHSKINLLRYVTGDLPFVFLRDEELPFAFQMLLKNIQNSGKLPEELNPHNW